MTGLAVLVEDREKPVSRATLERVKREEDAASAVSPGAEGTRKAIAEYAVKWAGEYAADIERLERALAKARDEHRFWTRITDAIPEGTP